MNLGAKAHPSWLYTGLKPLIDYEYLLNDSVLATSALKSNGSYFVRGISIHLGFRAHGIYSRFATPPGVEFNIETYIIGLNDLFRPKIHFLTLISFKCNVSLSYCFP